MSASPKPSHRESLYEIIFGHDSWAGKAFDVALLIAILTSVMAVVLETVPTLHPRLRTVLRASEWVFTVAFTIEYGLRIYSARQRLRYVTSFFGAVDLLALLPTFISLVFPGAQSLLVVRVLRVLRVFRVLKLVRFYGQADVLMRAVVRSLPKITVFLGAVLSVVVIAGAVMYLVEGPEHGFPSILAGMYWAVVTVTTVGFGDITPQTPVGRFLASLLMVFGYAIIAVPTGIMSSEMVRGERPVDSLRCGNCGIDEHAADAGFCRCCGAALGQKKSLS